MSSLVDLVKELFLLILFLAASSDSSLPLTVPARLRLNFKPDAVKGFEFKGSLGSEFRIGGVYASPDEGVVGVIIAWLRKGSGFRTGTGLGVRSGMV